MPSTRFYFAKRVVRIGELWRANAKKGIKSDYVFLNERGQPFGRMGIGRMIERAGEAAGLPFPVHVHMLRHSTGYALAGRGIDTRRLQHYLARLNHQCCALHRNVAGAVQGHLALESLPWDSVGLIRVPITVIKLIS